MCVDANNHETQGGHCESATKHDGQDFKTLLSAMQILGFSADEQDVIFRILASGIVPLYIYSFVCDIHLSHDRSSFWLADVVVVDGRC